MLQCIEVNKAAVDEYSFQMEVALWRDIHRNMQFPLPRLKSIIPLVFSVWNNIKGGSDATTNLMWHCKASVPNHNSNQALVVGRMLLLSAVVIHRILQITTAKT